MQFIFISCTIPFFLNKEIGRENNNEYLSTLSPSDGCNVLYKLSAY